MTLYQAYKKKRYDDGGLMDEGVIAQPKPNIMGAFGTAAGVGSGIIDATAKGDPLTGRVSKGATIGKGALSGAAAGAQFGPWGALIGGVVGGGVGLLKANKEKKEAMQMLEAHARDKKTSEESQSSALLATNPSLLTGYKEAGYFKTGGTIHIKPENRGKFNATKARTGKSTEELTHSSNPVTKKRAIFAQNAKKWKHENGGPIDAPLSKAYMQGGYAKSLSSDNTELVGRSHSKGGIDIPAAGVELEGKETTMGNFVFSDKLGFADEHKKIAKAKGLIENKPPTFERVNSMKRLKAREQNLAMMQEYLKQQNGIS